MAEIKTESQNSADAAMETMTISRHKATGASIGSTPLTSEEALVTGMEKARAAQKKWAQVPVSERAEKIAKLSYLITKNCDALADTISEDNGKTRIDALLTELISSAMAAGYYAKNARRFLKKRRLFPGSLLMANKISHMERVPFGVIGIISPWNYPFAIPFSEVVMGLLAGNAVILKTASETQEVGKSLKGLFEAIGLPDGLFQYVNMPGRIAGDSFLGAGVDKLFFTGSVGVGKYLMGKAAQTLTPVSLELGGNDAMIVCADADLERAAAGAVWGGFQNSGQSCGGVERIYVEAPVYDAFLALLIEKTNALRTGFDRDFNVDIGVMTTTRQKEAVMRHIDDALDRGARIVAKAGLRDSASSGAVCPVVLCDVSHDMLVMREETFGPVLGVMRVADTKEAVALANDSLLGLTGSVWTKNRKKGLDVASMIEAGAITINDHLMSHGLPETPWGGCKESGIGRTHGEIGFQEMTEPKVVITEILPCIRKNMWWHPHDKGVYKGLRGILSFLYGENIRVRIRGLMDMMRLFMRSFTP